MAWGIYSLAGRMPVESTKVSGTRRVSFSTFFVAVSISWIKKARLWVCDCNPSRAHSPWLARAPCAHKEVTRERLAGNRRGARSTGNNKGLVLRTGIASPLHFVLNPEDLRSSGFLYFYRSLTLIELILLNLFQCSPQADCCLKFDGSVI